VSFSGVVVVAVAVRHQGLPVAANGVVGAPCAQYLPERFVQFLKHLDVLGLPLPYLVSAAARIDRHPGRSLGRTR
jgi:hypothetical protein